MSEGIRDMTENVLVDLGVSTGIFPRSASWTAGAHTGNGRDVQEAQAAMVALDIDIGAATSVTVKLQHSLDNSTWTDLGAAKYGTGSAPAAITADGQHYFEAKDFYRYLRAVVTVAGGTATDVIAAIALQRGRKGPVTQWLTAV